MTTFVGQRVVAFSVAGDPVPQGSMRAFRRGNRAFVTHDKGPRLEDWRNAIGWAARAECSQVMEGPVRVVATFRLSRPKSRPKKHHWPDRKPDADKLARSLLDAISGVVIRDDNQVCVLVVKKTYAGTEEQPGVDVTISTLEEAAS